MYKKLLMLIPLLIIATLMGLVVYRKNQYHKTLKILKSISPDAVSSFNIYPRVKIPVEESVKFQYPDSLIDDFFKALPGIFSYSPNHDTVKAWGHSWFLEITTKDVTLLISCYIPSKKPETVVGELGRTFGERNKLYGYFQSRQLYDWYQKYSHRWLNPEKASPPAKPLSERRTAIE